MGKGGIYFFDIFLYYFINVIIKTLYISSFCRFVVYVLYFTHSSYSNKTQCILFLATPNFNKRTETFQITINDTVRHMEDKVKNLGVIFDSRLSFEHHIKSLCSRLNGTLSYLNRVKNMLDQKYRILLINAPIFSHLNYCSSILGKCSEKLQHEVQKCINIAAKVASNGKYLKRDHVTPLLRDLKWINFHSV